MAFEWYESDDTTAAGTAYSLSTTAGTASAAIELHAWLNKGSSVGTAETRHLRVYVLDSGTYKTSGLDTLDRREFEVRIIGSQNPDLVGAFVCPTTAWTSIGTRKTFQLPDIYPNCCIEIEVRINPGYEGGASSPVTFYIKAVQGTGEVPISIPDEVSVDGDLDMGGNTITNIERPQWTAPVSDDLRAAPVVFVLAQAAKLNCHCAATADVVWNDLVTNGDFPSDLSSWTGANWAQSAGTALHTAGATAALSQDVAVVAGVSYRVTLTVTGAAGTVTPSLGAVAGSAIAAGAGTVTQTLVAGETGTVALAFAPTTDFDGALDDVTLEEMFYGVGQTIDGVTIAAGNRVLMPLQTVDTQCGKWIASATTWYRHPDCEWEYELNPGSFLFVRDGAVNGRTFWVQEALISDVTTDPQVWTLMLALP